MKIIIKNLQSQLPLKTRKITKLVLQVLNKERPSITDGEISLVFVDDNFIRKLNQRYHKSNLATDVLAFDLRNSNNDNFFIADVVISCQTVLRNAALYHTDFDYELCLCVVHGVLHLLGYSDHTAEARKTMHKKAESLLRESMVLVQKDKRYGNS